MEDYVPNKRWCAHRIWCWPRVAVPGDQRARQPRGRPPRRGPGFPPDPAIDAGPDGDQKAARRLVTAGLAVAAPAALAGAADWSEQHEQQMRVGVVHAAGTIAAAALNGTSLIAHGRRAARLLRLAGLAAVSASGLLGGHISFRVTGGADAGSQGGKLARSVLKSPWSVGPAGGCPVRRPPHYQAHRLQ